MRRGSLPAEVDELAAAVEAHDDALAATRARLERAVYGGERALDSRSRRRWRPRRPRPASGPSRPRPPKPASRPPGRAGHSPATARRDRRRRHGPRACLRGARSRGRCRQRLQPAAPQLPALRPRRLPRPRARRSPRSACALMSSGRYQLAAHRRVAGHGKAAGPRAGRLRRLDRLTPGRSRPSRAARPSWPRSRWRWGSPKSYRATAAASASTRSSSTRASGRSTTRRSTSPSPHSLGLQEGGRLVGIISHVAELKERIDARLEVVAGQDGQQRTLRRALSGRVGRAAPRHARAHTSDRSRLQEVSQCHRCNVQPDPARAHLRLELPAAAHRLLRRPRPRAVRARSSSRSRAPGAAPASSTSSAAGSAGETLHLTRDAFGCGGAGRAFCGVQHPRARRLHRLPLEGRGPARQPRAHGRLGRQRARTTSRRHEHILIGPLRPEQSEHLQARSPSGSTPTSSAVLQHGAYHHHAWGEPDPSPCPSARAASELVVTFRDLERPQAAIGGTDIAMRDQLPPDVLAFTVTVPMFARLCALDDDELPRQGLPAAAAQGARRPPRVSARPRLIG